MSIDSKKVRFARTAEVIEVSPRKRKIPGKCSMPNDAPFSYSRSSFYNLLVHAGLIEHNIDIYNNFIGGEIGIYDLGVSSDAVDTLVGSIKRENMMLDSNSDSTTWPNDDDASLVTDFSAGPKNSDVSQSIEAINSSTDETHEIGTFDFQLPTSSSTAIVICWLLMDCDPYNGSRSGICKRHRRETI